MPKKDSSPIRLRNSFVTLMRERAHVNFRSTAAEIEMRLRDSLTPAELERWKALVNAPG